MIFVRVATRNDGVLRAYHEPTEDDVRIDYGGEVVARLGPDYGAGAGVSGNGVIVRRSGGWKAIVSTMVFGAKSATVESAEF